jgi:hypothetical protein
MGSPFAFAGTIPVMVGMPAGVRKLLVAYDVEHYTGRGRRLEFSTQQRLVDVLTFAFGEAGVSAGGYELQEQGDGGLALLPTGEGVDEPRMVIGLISALTAGLDELNEDLVAKAQVRLRVGLHEGVVNRAAHGFTGMAVDDVCRLRDSGAVRDMLAGSQAPLVVVVADHLYRDVLADSKYALRGAPFTQATVSAKEFTGIAWIYLPSAAAGQSGTRRRREPLSLTDALARPLDEI